MNGKSAIANKKKGTLDKCGERFNFNVIYFCSQPFQEDDYTYALNYVVDI